MKLQRTPRLLFPSQGEGASVAGRPATIRPGRRARAGAICRNGFVGLSDLPKEAPPPATSFLFPPEQEELHVSL